MNLLTQMILERGNDILTQWRSDNRVHDATKVGNHWNTESGK